PPIDVKYFFAPDIPIPVPVCFKLLPKSTSFKYSVCMPQPLSLIVNSKQLSVFVKAILILRSTLFKLSYALFNKFDMDLDNCKGDILAQDILLVSSILIDMSHGSFDHSICLFSTKLTKNGARIIYLGTLPSSLWCKSLHISPSKCL